ncbi:DUF502 domain-containing protein [Halosegnis sp.]|uniref:DUF502 domain-containing protein n=1 Tax=Halosegnis sp. TaxID=2864959 RepID=UPI0035D4D8EB
MSTGANDEDNPVERPDSLREVVRRSLITGTAVIIPLAVTVLVITFALNFVNNALQPIIVVIRQGPVGPDRFTDPVLKLITLTVFLALVFLLGFVAEFSKRGTKAGKQFDELMASIPGIGSVYTSFDEMSEIMLDSDTDSFQEVKLVEYPGEGSYTVAFKTASTPSVIGEATERDDMVTLFMPMAPNPVMGGFVIHVSRDRIVDVDLTVEQGIRSIVTSGVAIGGDDPELRGLSPDEMETLGRIERVDQQTAPSKPSASVRRSDVADDRIAEYDAAVDPEHSATPEKIADRQRDDDRDTTDTVPAEMSGRSPEDRDTTETTPAEASGRDTEDRDDTTTTPAERTGEDD